MTQANILLCALMVSLPCISIAVPLAVETRYGNVSTSSDFMKLMFNEEHLVNLQDNDDLEEFTLSRKQVFKMENTDIVLLQASRVPNCVTFRFLTLTKQKQVFSSVFGTCDYDAKFSQNGDVITVKMKTKLEGTKSAPVKFLFQNGIVTQVEKMLFWPQGYIEKQNHERPAK